MRARVISSIWLTTAVLLSGICGADMNPEGTSLIDYAGYTGCILLENEHTRVVLGPHCGGRVLSYAWKGEDGLYLNREDDGWVYTPGERIHLSGGRFDIGPENIIPRHPDLWFGPWTAEITGPRSARMTSVKDAATGVQLVRDFVLDAASSHLRCTQTIRNVSDEPRAWCHWARTFAKGGGICLVPLTPGSRFPKSYIMYGPGPVMNFRPEDPNIRVRDGFLEVLDTPEHPKLGIDSYAGWFCYLMPNDLMFVKRFPVYPHRVYNEMAALTISIWYPKDTMCELEPIGPMERLAPGASASFTEDWWLLTYAFPQQRDAVDLKKVTRVVTQHAR